MDTLSIAYAVSFNAAALILIAGVLWKMSIYARTPAPLGPRLTGNRIDPIHAHLPAPTTRGGGVF